MKSKSSFTASCMCSDHIYGNNHVASTEDQVQCFGNRSRKLAGLLQAAADISDLKAETGA